MNERKKLRAIMAGKRLVLMPGAYDALSARIIEAEGFQALVAGGYAGGRQHAGAGRHGAIQHARLCRPLRAHLRRGRAAGLRRRRHRLRRRQQCAADGARLRGGGRRRPVHQRPGVSQPLRLSAGQADRAGRADAGQGQGCARRAARSRPVHRRPHRRRGGRRHRTPPSRAASCSWTPAPTWRSPWASTPSRTSSGFCARSADRTWRRSRRRRVPRRAASRSWKRPASVPRPFLRWRCSRRRRRCATCCARSSSGNSLAPCQDQLIPLDDYYELVGLKPLLEREESYDNAAAALVRKHAAE